MAFNLQTWREQCKAYLKDLKRRIDDRKVDSIYGTIAAASLWPVIAAFQQGDFSALVALGQVLAGVGTNLLAGGLQSWRDRAEAERYLQARIKKEPALREEIDTIVEKLDAISIAKAELPEKERQWFVKTLQQELQKLGNFSRFQAAVHGPGAIAQGKGAKAVGEGAVVEGEVSGVLMAGEVTVGADVTGRDKTVIAGTDIIHSQGHVVFAEKGATVVIGEAPVQMDAVDRESALGRYLEHIIARNRYLQLQGIRSGGRLVHIELEQIYVTLRATQQRTVQAEEKWLNAEAALAPGEWRKLHGERPALTTETVTVSVNEAMAEHRRLVVLGDPGSGKTTLLRHLALLYARDLAQASHLVREKLGLHESGALPVLLPLRQIGAFLQTRHPAEDGTEGHALLLEFLHQSLKNERIELPRNFFDSYLQQGQAVVLLDGLDEVADPDLRRRVARLVEAFTRAYPPCRFVVTSRVVGYTGTARLGESYVTTTVRDFTLAEVERFLNDWHRLVAIGQMGQGLDAETYAQSQTRQLMAAIRSNERIQELAINPLMLQSVALQMHDRQQKEIEADSLRQSLRLMFIEILRNEREAEAAVDRFLRVIEERTGLLTARGEGVYAFSHLTFQEYLAALAIAARDDYVEYTLKRTPEPWWREVI